jgi:hypothetical protein
LRNLAAALALLLAAGCASFDGRGLQPGKATAEEVRALMGEPALVLKRPDGEARCCTSTASRPGPAMFVAHIGADGQAAPASSSASSTRISTA